MRRDDIISDILYCDNIYIKAFTPFWRNVFAKQDWLFLINILYMFHFDWMNYDVCIYIGSIFFSLAVCFLKKWVFTMLDMCHNAFLRGHQIDKI